MISQILSYVTVFITHTISVLGYPGLAILMGIQTIAIPIPSEIILPFAGFLAYTGRFNLLLIALVGGLGSSVGASIAYFIGLKGGRPLVEKYGRLILISKNDLQMADNFFAKHGNKAVFFGMLLPIVRSFISFPAGISKVPLKKFLFYVFTGSFIWSLVLGYFGMKLGENWELLRDKLKGFDIAIVVLIITVGVWWIWRHLKNSKIQSQK